LRMLFLLRKALSSSLAHTVELCSTYVGLAGTFLMLSSTLAVNGGASHPPPLAGAFLAAQGAV
jgi:hypothetical protein